MSADVRTDVVGCWRDNEWSMSQESFRERHIATLWTFCKQSVSFVLIVFIGKVSSGWSMSFLCDNKLQSPMSDGWIYYFFFREKKRKVPSPSFHSMQNNQHDSIRLSRMMRLVFLSVLDRVHCTCKWEKQKSISEMWATIKHHCSNTYTTVSSRDTRRRREMTISLPFGAPKPKTEMFIRTTACLLWITAVDTYSPLLCWNRQQHNRLDRS